MTAIAIRPALVATDQAERASSRRAGAPGFDTQLARRIEAAGITVERTSTPLTGAQAARALASAWQKQTGEAPSRGLLGVLVAQWAHETGHGRSMVNFNFGGIKGTSPEGLTVDVRTHEGSGAETRLITDRFRAYRSAESGALDYVRFLRARFPAAVEAAKAGDAAGFVHALKRGGYFTGSEDAYVSSVTSLTRTAAEKGWDAIGAHHVSSPGRPAPALARSVHVDPSALTDAISIAALRIGTDHQEDVDHEPERYFAHSLVRT